MARKVFIAVLGTGFYGKCKYVDQNKGFVSSETRFVQQATLEYINAKAWPVGNSDAIFFLTDKAKCDNWNESITERRNEPYFGLQGILKNMSLPFVPTEVHIPDGKNEKEMWEIFTILFNKLQEDDELYFDLTHSFRYLPMLVLVLGNYAKFLKHVTVKYISYGNYEARDTTTNEAPIVDLLPLSSLQDWTYAAGQFLESGNVEKLIYQCKTSLRPIMAETEGKDQQASALNKFVCHLQTFVEDIRTCRGMNIISANTISKLRTDADNLGSTIIEPMNPVFEKIKCRLMSFDKNRNIDNAYAAAKWCQDNEMYQPAATILQEAVVTFFCLRHNIDIGDYDKRKIVNKAFKIKAMNTPEDKWDTLYKEILEDVLSDEYLLNPNLISLFSNITEVRNDFNHSGMRSAKIPMEPARLKKNIAKCIDGFSILFHNEFNCEYKENQLLINLSNHPSSKWDSGQLGAAAEFGEIADMPFPDIDANGDEIYIENLADEYANKIRQVSEGKRATVHLMGEMTFTFALLSKLQAAGITCIASTSRRMVVDDKPGHREVTFQFVRFRKYNV